MHKKYRVSKVLLSLAATAVLVMSAGESRAAVMQGVETTSSPSGGQVHGLAIAFQFTVTESDGITATSLGYYNGWNPSTGLASNETVGIFSLSDLNANGSTTYNLLDSATVDAGTVDLFSGGYRFKDLTTPVYLPPGDYGVVAYDLGTNGDPYGDGVGPVFGSGIAPAIDTYQGVAFPNYPLGGTGDPAFHAAASFLYEPGNAVPEPASIGLAVLSAMGLMFRRRR